MHATSSRPSRPMAARAGRSTGSRTTPASTDSVLIAVPAWDFNLDDWSHARVAGTRSVENGVPMARTARNGLMTLNDRYGRVLLKVRSADALSVATGELPLAGSGGGTLYDRIGESFGWLTMIAGALLVLLGFGAATTRPTGQAQAERVASSASA